MKAKIMVVDDTEEVRNLIATILERSDYDTVQKGTAAQLLASFGEPQPDVILLDLQLPDGNGLELLPQIKKQWPDTEVIMLTGYATFDNAVEATKRGAYHFQSKPFDAKTLLVSLERAIEHRRLNLQTSSLHKALATMSGGASPIFQSPQMKSVVRTIERVAPSDVSILITGESGTGKEVVADLIHNMSPRNTGPLIKINCAALPRELIESELFGSVKGAFTGANVDREGLFRQAERGTLLLDEISEMPIDTQSKLLRVLQEKEVRPVGGRTTYRTDCRIIAATNRQTEEAIKSGKLREDLYYRIGAISVHLPPLRERRDDIIPLATAFLKRFDAQAGRNLNGFTPLATDALRNFEWPGNVRQLQNEIQRAVLMSEGAMIDVRDLSISPGAVTAEVPDLTLMEAMERNAILQMLKDTGGNKLETAKRLGIGRQTLYNKIKMYGIEA
ncbi:MAG TPA: sigma-54 dependent transcriptional regulator [Verrucomicrobiae bacterium]|jgi:DNA-binding NtrC family response regulator|nr:sigma-54 dependent transcriptional regulator [Verrucomicrobiae bacterium]